MSEQQRDVADAYAKHEAYVRRERQAAEVQGRVLASGLAGSGNISTAFQQTRDIGWAVKQMHDGCLVARRGWNGTGMWLALQKPDAHSKMTLPYVFMFTAQGQRVPWLCSQTDLLATDWEVVG